MLHMSRVASVQSNFMWKRREVRRAPGRNNVASGEAPEGVSSVEPPPPASCFRIIPVVYFHAFPFLFSPLVLLSLAPPLLLVSLMQMLGLTSLISRLSTRLRNYWKPLAYFAFA